MPLGFHRMFLLPALREGYLLTISFFFRRNELVNVDERRQQAALKEFYEHEALKQNNKKRIQSLKTFSKVINPLVCIGFVFAFWTVGLYQSFRGV